MSSTVSSERLRRLKLMCSPSVGRVARDRAGHAMPAAAAAAELAAAHRDHLDPGLAQQRVGVGVAVVGDDHAGLERDHVVAVVPLFALRLPGVAAGLDDAHDPYGFATEVRPRTA